MVRQGALVDIAPSFPAVLHGDVSGVVEAVGSNVSAFKVGDEVYSCGGGVKGSAGALAEYMPVDASLIAHKLKSLTMLEAAAMPLVSITAWEGLIDRPKVKPQQKVLIYGGTGGVGHIALQLAKNAGAKVYATVSNFDKGAIALSLGADVAINYKETAVEDFVARYTDGVGFDVVFDTVGNNNLQNAFKASKLNGTVISTVALSKQDLTLLHAKGLSLHLVYMLLPLLSRINRAYHGSILRQLSQAVDRGAIRPLLDSKTFSFSEIAAAHAHLESGRAIGKVVLSSDW